MTNNNDLAYTYNSNFTIEQTDQRTQTEYRLEQCFLTFLKSI